MKIETITYKRIKNLGNGESEEIEITAKPEGQNINDLTVFLRTFAFNHLYIYNSPDVENSPKPPLDPTLADPI